MPPRVSPVRNYLLQGGGIHTFADALIAVGERPDDTEGRIPKRNYAQWLSEALAVLFANHLREPFPQVLPNADGTGQESRARTGKGIKKLDVNYSTPELGLGLGLSIKTLNFRDPRTQRYTKNPTRVDNELRAEAADYHQRQPYAVLVGVLFVPADSCDDGDPASRTSRSSFAQIVNVLRHRAGRNGPTDDPQLFERIYIGLYTVGGNATVDFFDVQKRPPQFGRPAESDLINFDQLIEQVVAVYDSVNKVVPAWEVEEAWVHAAPLQELENLDILPEEDEESDSDAD